MRVALALRDALIAMLYGDAAYHHWGCAGHWVSIYWGFSVFFAFDAAANLFIWFVDAFEVRRRASRSVSGGGAT